MAAIAMKEHPNAHHFINPKPHISVALQTLAPAKPNPKSPTAIGERDRSQILVRLPSYFKP